MLPPQNQVQKEVSRLESYSRMLQTVPPIFVSMLAGPWSDRNGRRPVMVFAASGTVMAMGVLVANAYWFQVFYSRRRRRRRERKERRRRRSEGKERRKRRRRNWRRRRRRRNVYL